MSVQVRSLSPTDPSWADALRALPHDIYHTQRYLQIEAERV